MPEPLYDDPVVAEIHAIRAKMLADCGGDHRKLVEQVRAREQASGRRLIPTPPPHGKQRTPRKLPSTRVGMASPLRQPAECRCRDSRLPGGTAPATAPSYQAEAAEHQQQQGGGLGNGGDCRKLEAV